MRSRGVPATDHDTNQLISPVITTLQLNRKCWHGNVHQAHSKHRTDDFHRYTTSLVIHESQNLRAPRAHELLPFVASSPCIQRWCPRAGWRITLSLQNCDGASRSVVSRRVEVRDHRTERLDFKPEVNAVPEDSNSTMRRKPCCGLYDYRIEKRPSPIMRGTKVRHSN